MKQTEIVQLKHPRLRLFAKLESSNMTGSAKERSAAWILRNAVHAADIVPGTTVLESSSGNFALSLAAFSRQLDINFIPVIDPNINAQTEHTLRRMCRRVEMVEARDGTGGFLLSRLARVTELMNEISFAYWTDQYSNVNGARGHYELTGAELVASLGRIDYLFVGVGTGATINGLSHRVKESNPNAVVVAVDVVGSAVFGAAPHRRLIPGLGSSIRPPLIEDAIITDVVTVSEMDQVIGCRRLVREHGIFAGGSTGGVFIAISRFFENYRGPARVVVFLSMDGGDPYRDTVYNDGWVAANLESLSVTAEGTS